MRWRLSLAQVALHVCRRAGCCGPGGDADGAGLAALEVSEQRRAFGGDVWRGEALPPARDLAQPRRTQAPSTPPAPCRKSQPRRFTGLGEGHFREMQPQGHEEAHKLFPEKLGCASSAGCYPEQQRFCWLWTKPAATHSSSVKGVHEAS